MKDGEKNQTANLVAGIITLLLIIACVVFVGSAVVSGVQDAMKPVPTDTPAPTETPQQHAERVVLAAAPGEDKVTVVYSNGAVTVTDNMNPDTASKDWILEMGYDMQKAVWTSLLHPKSVTINFMGPVQDKYGHVSTALYASETLTAPTAAKFVWDNLTYQEAWDAFDQTWMRPDVASE